MLHFTQFLTRAGEEFDDHEILRRVIAIEREYLQARRLHHAVRNPAAQAIRQAIENDWTGCSYPRNTTVYYSVLLHKHMHAKTFLISMKSEQFMNRIKNKEISNQHQHYMYVMELYFTYNQCNETVTQLV